MTLKNTSRDAAGSEHSRARQQGREEGVSSRVRAERQTPVFQGLTPIADIDFNQNSHDDRVYQVQTNIFAHSVLAHLHTIVFGSWPGVPEKQQCQQNSFGMVALSACYQF